MFLFLVRRGYARSVSEAREMDARTVLQALAYERFLADYESTLYAMNRSE